MTSFNLKYLLKCPISKYNHTELELQQVNVGATQTHNRKKMTKSKSVREKKLRITRKKILFKKRVMEQQKRDV